MEEQGLFREVAADIAFALHNMEMEEQRKQAEHDLAERMKELECLYGIAKITERPGVTLDEVYQEVVNLLPSSWQYPEITCARVTINGRKFQTENFRDTAWKQSSDIMMHGAKAGEAEVSYLEERPELDEGPFLKEERLLIDAVTQQLGKITERKRAEKALQESEENLRAYLESAPDGVYINDLKGTFLYGNRKAEEIMGYTREELIGKSFLKLNLLPAKYLAKAGKLLALNAIGRPTGPDELELTRKDGSRIWVEINTTPIKQEGKVAVIGFARDITERKQAEEEIRSLSERESKSAREWQELFDASIDTIALISPDYEILRINKAGYEGIGKKREELIGKKCYGVIHGLHSPIDGCPCKDLIRTKKARVGEITQGGRHYLVTASPVLDENDKLIAFAHIIKDITERKRMEDQIKASLAEKELLLKEVHHRVKNNMQIVSSLLGLQAGGVEDTKTRELLEESQARIKSMALVYNQLYQSADLASIGLKDYVSELINGLVKTYASAPLRITAKIEGDNIPLGVDLAIPCGLFINELIINSLKYAFPNGRSGKIRVSLHETAENEVEIVVSDNGIGIPANLDLASTNTLGLYLVSTLVENQLGGKLELDRSQGTEFRITFNKKQT